MTPTPRPALRYAALAAAVTAALLAGCGQDSPAELMEKARASIAAKDAGAAEIHLKNLLQQKPDDGEARALLAPLHEARRDFASAEKEWRRALELGVSPDRALPGLLRAQVATGDAKGALEAASKYSATDPAAKSQAALWTGRAHASLGQPKEARTAWQASLDADPQQHLATVGLATLDAVAGERVRAEQAVDGVLAKAPALTEALKLKADLQLARGDRAGARDTLSKAIESEPSGVEPRARLVSVLIESADLDGAEREHAQMKKVAANHPATQYFGALIDFRRGRLDAARDNVLAALKTAPDYLPAIALQANVALAQGSLDLAETNARKIAERAPQSIEGARLLAAVQLRRDDPARALRTAVAAIDRGVDDPVLLGIAGEASLRRADYAAATRYFERAAKLDPQNPARRTGLGIAQIAAGKSDLGFGSLEAATQIDPANTQADLALISARVRAKQWPEALAAIDRLEKKQPDKPQAHALRGSVRIAQGDLPAARTSFERAVQIDPTFFPAIADLAELDLRERKPAEARSRLEQAVAKDPRNVQAAMVLARVLSRTGGTQEDVEKVLRQAQSANPASIEPVLALAELQIRTNRARDAVPMLQQALGQNPDDRRLLEQLGAAFLRTDEKQQAVDTFQKLVTLDPTSMRAQMRLGEVKAAVGDDSGAMGAFRQAATLDPKATAPRMAIAAMLVKGGKTDEARKIAASLQKELPNSAAGLALEGDLNAADGRWDAAAASYGKAIGIERSTQLVIKQHQALLKAGRAADADGALKGAIKAAPGDLQLRMYGAERAIATRRWAETVEHYDVVLKVAPNNVLALNNLAWSLKELGDSRALKTAEAAYALAPNAAAIVDTYGAVLLSSGDAKRAVEMFRKAASQEPKSPNYRLHLADALAVAGDKAGAKAEVDRLLADFPSGPAADAARGVASKHSL